MEDTALNKTPKFGIKDKVGYAMGDFGCNMSFALISSYMVDFFTQYIGIGGLAWSIIIIFTKIWDGINDPIMGTIMDNVKIGKGKSKFKPWIRLGSIGLIISGALVFLPIPNAANWVKIVVCVVTYLLWDICYTLLNVPYGALSNAITSDTIERAQLSTWRSIGAGLGGVLCMLIPLFVYDKNDNLIGGRFIWIGIIMGIIAFGAYTLCLKLTHERVAVPEVATQKVNYIKTLKSFLRNRPLLGLCLASFASIVFLMSSSQTTKWLFQTHFGEAGIMLTLSSVITYLPLAIFIPFTSKIVKKFGKRLAVSAPLFLSALGALILLVVPVPKGTTGSIIYIACLACIQAGGGLFNLLVWAMVNDCIDYQQFKTGEREEGSVYAMYSLFRKVAQGVAMSLPLLCMEAVGYNSQANPISAQAPGVSANMIKVSAGLMLTGAVLMLVAFFLVYNLGRKEVAEISNALGKQEEEIDVASLMNANADD
ncbi:MAG: MFS transporter [Clostridia bacterium]|nr:MFS transporter [Clostridia bacterium]